MSQPLTTADKILDNSLILFAEKGYKETTIDEIAKACGIAKGSIYVYYKSKEEIALAVLSKSIEETKNLIFSVKNIADPYKRIAQLIKKGFKYILDNEKYWRSLNNLASQSDLKKLFEKNFFEYQNIIITKISIYLKELGIPNYKFEAKMLLSFFDGIQLHYYSNRDKKFFTDAKKYLLKRYSKDFLDVITKLL